MISFVWEEGLPLPAGTGGSENYTTGHVRELNRRGVAARVVTVGVGTVDGREEFDDIPFLAVEGPESVSELEGTVIFVTDFPNVATRNPPFQILHVPPPRRLAVAERFRERSRSRSLIATSRYSAQMWADFLDVDPATIAVVYPFAETCFSTQGRARPDATTTKILYAGRLSPEKGIYTLLASMHSEHITDDQSLAFTATTAGEDKPQGAIIRLLLEAHPGIEVVSSRRTPQAMATLMAENDIVVIPSNSQYWHETFGIVSIEAQHAGCRVIAADDGGLPETDCGALTLVTPDDPDALAAAISRTSRLDPVQASGRADSSLHFSVGESVDALLQVLSHPRPPTPAQIVSELEALITLDFPDRAASGELTLDAKAFRPAAVSPEGLAPRWTPTVG